MRRLVIVGVLVAGLAGLAFALRRYRTTGPAVPTAAATQGPFQVTVSLRATLQAAREVVLRAPNVSNLQIVWLAPAGLAVKSGEPVIRFDPSTVRKDMDAKSAALRQAQATLDQAQAAAAIADQQDALDLATDQNGVASAQLDADKAAILSPIDGDEAKLALGMAQEKLKVEQATIALHRTSNAAKIASATRNRDKAKADLDLDQSYMQQMVIHSPLAGVVTYLTNYSQGWTNRQPFKVGDHVWPNGEIAAIPDLASLWADAKVNEIERGQIAVGQTVDLRMDALPELAIQGKVESISALAQPYYDGSFPPAKAFDLFAALHAIDPRLRPEMNGSCNVVVRRIPNAISIPAPALFAAGGRPVVFVRQGNRFVQQAVTVLAQNPDEVALAGLSAGVQVALQDPRRSSTKSVTP